MMTIATETVAHLYTTPKALRQLADEMERLMPFKRIGEDVTTHTIFTGPHTLKIVADQTEYNKFVQARENQNWK
jgi:hypothetical protein